MLVQQSREHVIVFLPTSFQSGKKQVICIYFHLIMVFYCGCFKKAVSFYFVCKSSVQDTKETMLCREIHWAHFILINEVMWVADVSGEILLCCTQQGRILGKFWTF